MQLSHLDCRFLRGREATLDTSSYIALNPRKKAGSLVVAGASAARSNIGGQVACRLSLEHFVDGVFECLEGGAHTKQTATNAVGEHVPAEERELSLEILEAAFRKANTSVYNFGHKLAAGGRMAASLLGLVVEEGVIAAGRVGGGSSYLFRDGELFPFFENLAEPNPSHAHDVYVGSNSLVSVELASVPAQANDIILLFSGAPLTANEGEISESVKRFAENRDLPSDAALANLLPFADEMAFVVAARLGPHAVYLSNQMRVC